jgi:hypothetical protein
VDGLVWSREPDKGWKIRHFHEGFVLGITRQARANVVLARCFTCTQGKIINRLLLMLLWNLPARCSLSPSIHRSRRAIFQADEKNCRQPKTGGILRSQAPPDLTAKAVTPGDRQKAVDESSMLRRTVYWPRGRRPCARLEAFCTGTGKIPCSPLGDGIRSRAVNPEGKRQR